MNESYGWGFLQPVADLFIRAIDALYQVTAAVGFPSYALAIIMISILIKLILYPLMKKQMKSTMNMQEVQPKIQYLQKKYKNNPEKMNEEVDKIASEECRRYKGKLGYCHIFWATKKRLFKEMYDIDWLSPAERNPHIIFD